MSEIVSIQNPFDGLQHMSLEEAVPLCMQQLRMRQDSGDAAMFLRQLTYVYQQGFDVEYPELKARKYIPLDSRIPSGALNYVWHQYDMQGRAKVTSDYASDAPNAEVAGLEFSGKIVSLRSSYQYTIQDLRAATMAGMPLETRKAAAARRVIENELDKIAFLGITAVTGDALPIYGLTNFPNMNTANTTNTWTSSTVLQIIQDINKAAKTVFDNTKGIHQVNTMLLDTATYSYLASTPRSPTFTDDTMLQYILKQSPWLKTIDYCPVLDLASTLQDNTTPGPCAVLYDKSPEVLNLIIPQDFEQFAPQARNMSCVTDCHMRTGGVNVYKPKALVTMKGYIG